MLPKPTVSERAHQMLRLQGVPLVSQGPDLRAVPEVRSNLRRKLITNGLLQVCETSDFRMRLAVAALSHWVWNSAAQD